jgi:YbbR domain-containing protein
MNLLKNIDSYKQRFNQSKFQRNAMPKLLSIFFAVIFWLYVMDQVNPEMVKTIVDVKVELMNIESVQSGGLVMMGDKDFFINVKIKGRRSEVIKVVSGDLLITADLQGFQKGVNNVVLNSRIFVDNVSIEALSQNSIKVTLDRIVEVAKPVKMEYVGKLSANYTIGDLSISPDQILVKGPESLINSIVSIKGDIDLTDVNTQVTKDVPVVAVDIEGNTVNGVQLGRSYVSAQLGILKLMTLPIKTVLIGEVANGYKLMHVETLPALLTLKGDDTVISQLSEIMTSKIDLNGLTENTELEADLVIPDGLSAPFAENTVSVKLNIEPIITGSLEYKDSEIQFANADPLFNYEFLLPSETTYVVYVKDGKSIVDSLDKNTLGLSIDVKGLTEGDHRVMLVFEKSSAYESVQLTPDAVTIRVTRK